MYHLGPITIKDHGTSSFFYPTVNQAKHLIVFVHGFNGSAGKTWGNFHNIAKKREEFRSSDIISYGYESLRYQVADNAVSFYDFLVTVLDKGHDVFKTLKRQPISYDRIIIVGHSLGAIVVRRALLYAKRKGNLWLPKIRMIFFAPAHRGARLQNLVGMLPPLLRIGYALTSYRFPVIEDLKPDSLAISSLIVDTQAYLANSQGDFTVAHAIVRALDDKVVFNEDFCRDPLARLMPGQDHVSVCKPFEDHYEEPIEIVSGIFKIGVL